MLEKASVIGFVPVSDFAAAESFYAGKLGLRVVDPDNPYALVLAMADGTAIHCALAPQVKPREFTILGWEVDDVHSAMRELAALGIEPLRFSSIEQAEDGVWTDPAGDKVAWFHDPDGNVLSFSQHVGRTS